MSNIAVLLFCVVSSLLLVVAATTADNYGFSISQSSTGLCNARRSFFGRQNLIEKVMRIRGGASSVLHIASIEEFDRILSESAGKLVVVDFSATWCMPCKLIAPVFDEMSSPEGEFGNVVFMKVDVDEVPELAERFQVQSMPTFLFMKDSEEIDRFSGASVEKLKQTIVEHSN